MLRAMDLLPVRAASGVLDALLRSLSVEEKASLTSGQDLWSVPAIERAGIRKLVMTDGPNGARGPVLPGQPAVATTCVPCGSALGATWDTHLVGVVGALLGDEARAHDCRALLAPTVNIPRSPLAGRNFECYAEDPLLSGRLAAAFVDGVQSCGVVAVIKHFAANDAETERMTVDSVVDERTLRELYLLPFEIGVREGGALGLMTAYNRVNGIWCSEHAELISLARNEWGFGGVVITDWFAVASTEASSRAGVDIEMPGPGRAYGETLGRAVREGRVPEDRLDAQVGRILGLLDRLELVGEGASDGMSPPRPSLERRQSVAYQAAAESFVLLKNDGLLPLDTSLRQVALIGPAAGNLAMMGGGSAQVFPDPTASLLDAMRASFGDGTTIGHEAGVDLARSIPVLDIRLSIELHRGQDLDGEVVHRSERPNADVVYGGAPHPAIEGAFSIRATGTFAPDVDGPHRFTLTEVGRARLFVDDRPLIDGTVGSRSRGPGFFGAGRAELAAEVDLAAGRPTSVVVEYYSDGAGTLSGFRIGCAVPTPSDLVQRAEELAAASDAVVLVVGTTHEWESEGFDRDTLHLPAGQDDLIARILTCNPRTVVVVNTGAPVAMEWADRVPAILQAWFGGQEMGAALADVLVGWTEPAGRLPVTIPASIELTPAYGNFPGDGDRIVYGERVLVGYRWYESRGLPVRFPFGHGLSYSTFALGSPTLSRPGWTPGEQLEITLLVTNTGDRPGSEVVQCYVEPPPGPILRPARELKGFSKVHLAPGESTLVTIRLDGRSFAHWRSDEAVHADLLSRLPMPFLAPRSSDSLKPAGWRVDPGTYVLHLGRSSADLAWSLAVDVEAADLDI
jgi:beta-glucosidase